MTFFLSLSLSLSLSHTHTHSLSVSLSLRKGEKVMFVSSHPFQQTIEKERERLSLVRKKLTRMGELGLIHFLSQALDRCYKTFSLSMIRVTGLDKILPIWRLLKAH
jgi:hypothetical protein